MSGIRVVALACALLSGNAALANLLNPMPLDQQRDQADVVVIATAGRNTSCMIGGVAQSCVEINDPVFLKGAATAGGRQYLITYHRAFEARVRCCRTGQRYLMFLRGSGAHLGPVAGYSSVLQIDSDATAP